MLPGAGAGGTEVRISWAALGGLYAHLAWARALAHVPLVLAHAAASFVLGWSAPWLLAGAVLMLLLQSYVIGPFASLLILPGQRRLLDVLAFVDERAPAAAAPAAGSWAGAARRALLPWLPAVIGEHAGALRQQLVAMTRAADGARAALLAAPLRGAPLAVLTPDGVRLDACVFGGDAAASPRGVIVYCGGNAELFAFNRAFASYALRHRLAVVLFDYRGVGRSGGTISRGGGVTDVASVLAACLAPRADGGLGYAPAQVLVFGHSIGGAFGAEAARFHPGVALVADRTFGVLSEVAWHHLYPRCVQPESADALASRAVRWVIHELVAHAALWQLDTAAHFQRIGAARKALLFHAADGIIPLAVQLAPKLIARHGYDAAAWGVEAEAEVAAAAAAPDAADAAHGLGAVLQLSGGSANAHNRELSADEEAAFFRAVVEPLLGYSSAPGGAVRALPKFTRL